MYCRESKSDTPGGFGATFSVAGFGVGKPVSSTPGPTGLFQTAAAVSAANPTTGIFGTAAAPTTGIFNNLPSTTSTGSIFSVATATPETATPAIASTTSTNPGGIFGLSAAKPTGNIFGGSPSAAYSAGFNFGAVAPTTPSSSLFGCPSTQTAGQVTPAKDGGDKESLLRQLLSADSSAAKSVSKEGFSMGGFSFNGEWYIWMSPRSPSAVWLGASPM